VTAMVATLAIALASIPESQLANRLPVTTERATALVTQSARTAHVSVAGARKAMTSSPYARPPLRYLYAAGWITGRQKPSDCIFAKVTPEATEQEMARGLRANLRLAQRLRRMHVTVAQAASALTRGAASAC